MISTIFILLCFGNVQPPPEPKEPPPPFVQVKPAGVRLVVTDRTEVRLDGVAVKWADVPGDAEMIHVEVAADRRTVVKIEFRSKGRP